MSLNQKLADEDENSTDLGFNAALFINVPKWTNLYKNDKASCDNLSADNTPDQNKLMELNKSFINNLLSKDLIKKLEEESPYRKNNSEFDDTFEKKLSFNKKLSFDEDNEDDLECADSDTKVSKLSKYSKDSKENSIFSGEQTGQRKCNSLNLIEKNKDERFNLHLQNHSNSNIYYQNLNGNDFEKKNALNNSFDKDLKCPSYTDHLISKAFNYNNLLRKNCSNNNFIFNNFYEKDSMSNSKDKQSQMFNFSPNNQFLRNKIQNPSEQKGNSLENFTFFDHENSMKFQNTEKKEINNLNYKQNENFNNNNFCNNEYRNFINKNFINYNNMMNTNYTNMANCNMNLNYYNLNKNLIALNIANNFNKNRHDVKTMVNNHTRNYNNIPNFICSNSNYSEMMNNIEEFRNKKCANCPDKCQINCSENYLKNKFENFNNKASNFTSKLNNEEINQNMQKSKPQNFLKNQKQFGDLINSTNVNSVNNNLDINFFQNDDTNCNKHDNIYIKQNKNFLKNETAKKKKKPFIEREGDWVCHQCKNLNFSFRLTCNRCQITKEENEKLNLNVNENFYKNENCNSHSDKALSD